jgi:hypothetical protein
MEDWGGISEITSEVPPIRGACPKCRDGGILSVAGSHVPPPRGDLKVVVLLESYMPCECRAGTRMMEFTLPIAVEFAQPIVHEDKRTIVHPGIPSLWTMK